MSKKLVIRINNLQNLEKNDAYEVIEETTIRWDRVIGFAVFALLLVIAAIVGLVTVFNSNTTDKVELSTESSIEAVSVERSNEASEEIVSDTGVVIPEQKTMPEQESVLQQLPAQQDRLIVNEAEAANVPVVEAVVVEKVVVEKVVIEKVAVENIASIEPKSVVSPPVEQIPSQFILSDPIDIKSEKIVRAQLTNGVSKREPVDKLGSSIPMNDQGLIKVFLFTDMHGLKGETLYHEWYLAGKRMARVKINVRNNNVSASSSKFIDKYMMGDWKVNVVNHSGDTLVSAQFIVAP